MLRCLKLGSGSDWLTSQRGTSSIKKSLPLTNVVNATDARLAPNSTPNAMRPVKSAVCFWDVGPWEDPSVVQEWMWPSPEKYIYSFTADKGLQGPRRPRVGLIERMNDTTVMWKTSP